MPAAPPPVPTYLVDTSIPPTNLQNNFDPTTMLPTTNLSMNLHQSQVVTTPISLPGMPPITVSASLPQTTAFYPPDLIDPSALVSTSNTQLSTSAQ